MKKQVCIASTVVLSLWSSVGRPAEVIDPCTDGTRISPEIVVIDVVDADRVRVSTFLGLANSVNRSRVVRIVVPLFQPSGRIDVAPSNVERFIDEELGELDRCIYRWEDQKQELRQRMLSWQGLGSILSCSPIGAATSHYAVQVLLHGSPLILRRGCSFDSGGRRYPPWSSLHVLGTKEVPLVKVAELPRMDEGTSNDLVEHFVSAGVIRAIVSAIRFEETPPGWDSVVDDRSCFQGILLRADCRLLESPESSGKEYRLPFSSQNETNGGRFLRVYVRSPHHLKTTVRFADPAPWRPTSGKTQSAVLPFYEEPGGRDWGKLGLDMSSSVIRLAYDPGAPTQDITVHVQPRSDAETSAIRRVFDIPWLAPRVFLSLGFLCWLAFSIPVFLVASPRETRRLHRASVSSLLCLLTWLGMSSLTYVCFELRRVGASRSGWSGQWWAELTTCVCVLPGLLVLLSTARGLLARPLLRHALSMFFAVFIGALVWAHIAEKGMVPLLLGFLSLSFSGVVVSAWVKRRGGEENILPVLQIIIAVMLSALSYYLLSPIAARCVCHTVESLIGVKFSSNLR